MTRALEFHPLTMEDMPKIKPLLKEGRDLGCEFTFGNMICWGEVYHPQVAYYDSMCTIRYENRERLSYSFPIGDGDMPAFVELMAQDAIRHGKKMAIHGVTEPHLEQVKCLGAAPQCDRADSDYVYLAEHLIKLPGKKYHGKRNHISFFKKNYDWRFEILDDGNMPLCKAMYEKWYQQNIGEDPSLSRERKALELAFDQYHQLELLGGVLYAGGEVVAFTVGEEQNEDVFVIHFEKALNLRGAYPMINQQFAANCLTSYLYINREEDMGLEGLRKAKLSYYPDIVLDKFFLDLETVPCLSAAHQEVLHEHECSQG